MHTSSPERTWIYRGVEQAFRLLRRYHQHTVHGFENVPRTGPAVFASNHSFAMYDSFLLAVPILDELGRHVHGLADHTIFKTPGVGRVFKETGFVPGTRDAAIAFLREGNMVGCMPGGMREALRGERDKYQFDWEGRTGFVWVSMLSGAPIVLSASPRGDDIFDVHPTPLTEWALKRFHLPLALVRGWGPTLVPRPVPLVQLVSEPLVPDVAPEQVTERDVLAQHARVVARMKRLMKDALDLAEDAGPTGTPVSGRSHGHRASTSGTADARAESFAKEIDAIGREIHAKLGPDDVRYVKRVDRISRGMEVLGRSLIHFSVEPVSFAAGVGALFLHKQLQATEIGHTVMHGAYDRLKGTPEHLRARSFRWDAPMDELSWRVGHNLKHHNHPNVLDRDGDTSFGPIRLTRHIPYRWFHRYQGPLARGTLPFFGMAMALQFAGAFDPRTRDGSAMRALRKLVPYYTRNYLLYPALAGPFFPKVLLGNWLAERMRDTYTSAVIYCGHVGAEVAQHEAGYEPATRAHGLIMQVESSQNFEVPWVLSLLAGGLDRQIEHHLFPRLPPHRLREIAPRVRAVCDAHGVRYLTGSFPEVFGRVFSHIDELARPPRQSAPVVATVHRDLQVLTDARVAAPAE